MPKTKLISGSPVQRGFAAAPKPVRAPVVVRAEAETAQLDPLERWGNWLFERQGLATARSCALQFCAVPGKGWPSSADLTASPGASKGAN